jgi:hypothetical protein
MKKEFREYLASLDIRDGVLSDRIDSIHKFFLSVCPDMIRGIFVTEYIDSEGIREYEDLWFFSHRCIMQAKGFARGRDNFSIAPLHNCVTHYRVIKQDYDFKKATERSRLHIVIGLSGGISVDLKASKENCDALRMVILTHVKLNLKG